MILTRYLHNFDSLVVALIKCISERNEGPAIYFAYELYFSGWENVVWDIVWEYYFLNIALASPEYEFYLKSKEKNWKQSNNYWIIKEVILDLFIRKLSVLKENENYKTLNKKSVKDLLEIYKDPKNNLFNKARMIKYNPRNMKNIDKEILILRIIQLKTQVKAKKIEFYIDVSKEEVIQYATRVEYDAQSWKILRDVVKYNPDDYIDSKVNNLPASEFMDNWLFYAKDCPLWKKRLLNCKYKIYNSKIDFEDEDEEEDFWNKYNLEPDEQPKEIQERLNCYNNN